MTFATIYPIASYWLVLIPVFMSSWRILAHRKNGNLCKSMLDGILPISLLYIAILSANMQGAGILMLSAQL